MAEPLAPLKASGALYRPCYVEIAFFVSILFDIGPNISHSLRFTVLFAVVFLRNFYLAVGTTHNCRKITTKLQLQPNKGHILERKLLVMLIFFASGNFCKKSAQIGL